VSAPHIAGSYSRIDMFKRCPKRFWHTNIAKDLGPYVQTEQQKQGDLVHKILEKYIRDGQPVPPGYEYLIPLASAVRSFPGTSLAELQLAVDANLRPCGSKEWDKVWIRFIIDVLKLRGNVAWAGDWKTGKRTFDELQLKMFAAAVFVHYPDVDTVATNYVWLREKNLDKPMIYHRNQLADMWGEINGYMQQIQEAARNNHWPAKKNPFCGWCPVLKVGKCDEAHGVKCRI